MSVTAADVAKALLPGWKPVKKPAPPAIAADSGAPTVQALCKKYGINSVTRTTKDGLKAASSTGADLEFVVMAPPTGDATAGNKVVIVANGKVVAVQG